MTLTGRTIKQRLMLAAALATLAVWVGIFLQYVSLQQERQRSADVRRELDESGRLGALASALARERGRTQALMAPQATPQDSAEVAERRADTDRQLEPLTSVFAADSLQRAQLSEVRRAIDQRRTEQDTAFGTYSALVADVNLLASRRLASAMLRLGLPFEHVNALRDAVERASRVRGLVSGALGVGQLTPAALELLRDERLLAEEALRRAMLLAPASGGLQGRTAGPRDTRWMAWDQEWQSLRADPQGYLQRTTPERWWTVASAAIDAAQSDLDLEVQSAIAAAEGQIAQIQQRVYWAVAAMVVLGLASVGLLLATVARVVRGLGRLLGGIETVTEKRDLGARILVKETDEFGQIGHSVNTLVGTIEGLMAEREAQAELDGLTRVLNRVGLDRHLAARTNPARRSLEPFGLLLLDIDHFKRINDEFGHLQGDAVLVGVANAARASLRPDDTLGRWGGEEFVVVLSGGEVDLMTAADKVRLAIAAADVGLGRPVTTSIGATLWRPGSSVQDAFQRADEALYKAKSGGRNRCVVA